LGRRGKRDLREAGVERSRSCLALSETGIGGVALGT
jgi:hypothetical protein